MHRTLVTQILWAAHIAFKCGNARYCNTWPCRCGIKPGW